MLKIMLLRKKYNALQQEADQLRSKQAGFATREADLASQVEAASTEAEVSAVAEAVNELETAQKTTKERLQAIKDECDAILQEIEEAENAAAAAANAGGDGGEGAADGSEGRSARSNGSFQRRCRDFQRTGRMVYDNVRSMVKRAAVLSSSTGVIGPTGVSGINDAADNTVSSFIDLIKVTDCTGMASYKVAYMNADPTAAKHTEGKTATESEPSFGSVELTPTMYSLLAYISREIRKQSPLQYEAKVHESVTRALRRTLSKVAVDAVLASTLNDTLALTGSTGAALFTPTLLSDIILAYGGDEGVDGAACLVLNKADLKAFAAVRGKNEFLPVYSIVPDTANPSCGVIKDNNGLSCRYCLSKDVAALSTATLTATAKKGMFYGNPQCEELALWGALDVTVNEGYKFGEGLLSIMGEVSADADVTVPKGFIVVTAKTA